MRKLFYLFLFFGFTHLGSAQVLLNPHPVSGFQISSNDILNFDVINTLPGTDKDQGVYASFRISVYLQNGQEVLQMISSRHLIPVGVTNFNSSNINIISKRYTSSEISNYEEKMRSFPMGSYSYCLDIVCEDTYEKCTKHFIQEDNRKECQEFSVMPMSPLLLSLPEDEEVVKNTRPNFNWIPPMPLGSDPDISYELTLVHLEADQKAEDGIRRNRPIYERDGIPAINMTFPTTLEDLEPGEHYGWQVHAYLGKILATTSEVWEFEVEEEKVLEGSLVNINKDIIGIHKCTENLRFSYYSRINQDYLNYKIFDSENNEVPGLIDFSIKRGDNVLILTQRESELENDKIYHLVISEPRGTELKLNFTFYRKD